MLTWVMTHAGSEDDSEGSDYEEVPRGGHATASGRDDGSDQSGDEDAEGVSPFKGLYMSVMPLPYDL